jgi:Zn-finger nucleic acid-binding protein
MASVAPTYSCASCGAPVAELSRRCQFCAAPVATVRCGHCFQMNVAEAAHCAGCGRQLGLEPASSAGGLECPRCTEQLEAFAAENHKLYDCGCCGGQFVEHELLARLLERRELYGSTLPRRLVKPQNPLNDPVVYLRCPSCKEHMNRKNFGGSSGVVIDTCANHGIWFDTGELPRVLAFVEQGGLERARLRGAESERRRERERRQALGPVLAAYERGNFEVNDVGNSPELLTDIADVALSLFELVRD